MRAQSPGLASGSPRWRYLLVVGVVVAGLVACDSPEARRSRGGGPGADIGNRRQVVQMHEGSKPFHDTPRLVRGGLTELKAAEQARQVSQR
jgi:hypothetical protein